MNKNLWNVNKIKRKKVQILRWTFEEKNKKCFHKVFYFREINK